jgi:hypothetical protein
MQNAAPLRAVGMHTHSTHLGSNDVSKGPFTKSFHNFISRGHICHAISRQRHTNIAAAIETRNPKPETLNTLTSPSTRLFSRLAPYKCDVCWPAYVVHAVAMEPKVKTNKTLMCEECSWACSSEILPRPTPFAGPLSGCDSRWGKRQSEGSGACFAARVRTSRTKG